MPLDTSDPWYRRETAPPALVNFRESAITRLNLPRDHVGIKGSVNHWSGYHRSRNWITNSPDSAYGWNDYSVRSTDDRAGDGDWLSGVDITFRTQVDLIAACNRLKAAADRNDARLQGWREFLGTRDGRTPYGLDFIAFYTKRPDPSHLHHLHLSRVRRYANTSMTAILDIIEGEDDMEPIDILRLRQIHARVEALIKNSVSQTPENLATPPSIVIESNELKAAVAASGSTVTLTPEQLEALAVRVADLLRPSLITPAQVEQAAYTAAQRAENS